MSTNIYKKLNLTSTFLLQKQHTFSKLPCINTPTHKIKEKDEEGNVVEKDVASLEVGKEYQIMRTELKDTSSNTKEKDLYLIVGSIDGLLFMNEKELSEYFDLSVLNSDTDYKLSDAPFYKTGMVIEGGES